MSADGYSLETLLTLASRPSSHLYRVAMLERFTQEIVTAAQKAALLKRSGSFGAVIADPAYAGRYDEVWDSPRHLVAGGIVLGWGPEKLRFSANALRKLRAVARTGRDTQDLAAHAAELFRDSVKSVIYVDGRPVFPWGDYPFGGGVILGGGASQLMVSVSSLLPDEDDLVARIIGQYWQMLTCRGN